MVVTNSLGFSGASDVYVLGALPLTLTSFTAQKLTGNRVKLNWNTAYEQNIKGYNILRKENNQADFYKIGFVGSKTLNGSSVSALSYLYVDSLAPDNSNIFYRLQIVNTDGYYTYSDIRSITPGILKNNFIFSPNPAKGQVKVLLEKYTTPVLMALYDNSGRKIKEQTLSQQNNSIDLTGLKGIYIVQLSDGDGTEYHQEKTGSGMI